MLTKFSRHTQHEVSQALTATINEQATTEITVRGDSIINVPGTSVQAIMPFNLDTLCTDVLDSIITGDVKIYAKPVYYIGSAGKMVFKGIQIQAITAAKTITPTYTTTMSTTAKMQAAVSATVHVNDEVSTMSKKRDNSIGGYIAFILIISLLCVGFYVAKKTKLI